MIALRNNFFDEEHFILFNHLPSRFPDLGNEPEQEFNLLLSSGQVHFPYNGLILCLGNLHYLRISDSLGKIISRAVVGSLPKEFILINVLGQLHNAALLGLDL